MSRAVAASEIRANSVPFLPRAKRSSELTLLACWLACTTSTTTPSTRTAATTISSSTTNLPLSLIQRYLAGTCREHAQAKYAKSWDTRLFTSFSDTLPSRYTARPHTRAQHAPTYLSIAHFTTPPPNTLEHPPSSSTTTSRLPLSCTP